MQPIFYPQQIRYPIEQQFSTPGTTAAAEEGTTTRNASPLTGILAGLRPVTSESEHPTAEYKNSPRSESRPDMPTSELSDEETFGADDATLNEEVLERQYSDHSSDESDAYSGIGRPNARRLDRDTKGKLILTTRWHRRPEESVAPFSAEGVRHAVVGLWKNTQARLAFLSSRNDGYDPHKEQFPVHDLPFETIEAIALQLSSARDIRSFSLSCATVCSALKEMRKGAKEALQKMLCVKQGDFDHAAWWASSPIETQTYALLYTAFRCEVLTALATAFSKFNDDDSARLWDALELVDVKPYSDEYNQRKFDVILNAIESLPAPFRLTPLSALRKAFSRDYVGHANLERLVGAVASVRQEIESSSAITPGNLLSRVKEEEALLAEIVHFREVITIANSGLQGGSWSDDSIDAVAASIQGLSPSLQVDAAEYACHFMFWHLRCDRMHHRGMRMYLRLKPFMPNELTDHLWRVTFRNWTRLPGSRGSYVRMSK